MLDKAEWHFNQRSFIEFDPISIPHQYKKKQDIEIGWTAHHTSLYSTIANVT
jgi:hypothetical protein